MSSAVLHTAHEAAVRARRRRRTPLTRTTHTGHGTTQPLTCTYTQTKSFRAWKPPMCICGRSSYSSTTVVVQLIYHASRINKTRVTLERERQRSVVPTYPALSYSSISSKLQGRRPVHGGAPARRRPRLASLEGDRDGRVLLVAHAERVRQADHGAGDVDVLGAVARGEHVARDLGVPRVLLGGHDVGHVDRAEEVAVDRAVLPPHPRGDDGRERELELAWLG